MYQWVAYHLPRKVMYWVVIKVWAHLTVAKFPERTPEDVTVFDALREYGS